MSSDVVAVIANYRNIANWLSGNTPPYSDRCQVITAHADVDGMRFALRNAPIREENAMKKPISPRIHGMLDYSTAAAVAAAPRVLDMPTAASRLFESLAGGYTALSSVTDYPLSLKRVVPFKGHGAAEVAIALALPAMPWLLGFAENRAARNLCFGLTAMTFAIAALTDWDAPSRRKAAAKRKKRRQAA
jgi:hypothetical protein